MGGTVPATARAARRSVISPKYVGQQRLIEIAVATLATDRALLLLGVPGTAKTWVSEHLAAAISGDSTLLVQGTAGTTEETLRYGWNYARLLTEGPSREALVPGPVYRGMQRGAIVRVEELTRMPAEVQDALVTVLSEKVLPVPELDTEIAAVRGFNLIATANDRDRGVNELSSALRRRFNTVVLPLPATAEEEIAIVSRRVGELGATLSLPDVPAAADEIARVVTIFRELRSGVDHRSAHEPEGPDRHAVDRRGDLGGHQRARARRALRRRPASAPPMSPAGMSVPSSATRCATPSPGGSTSRRWSATATVGVTSTTPAAPSTSERRDVTTAGTARRGAPAATSTCSACAITAPARPARSLQTLDADRSRRWSSSNCPPTSNRRCGGSATTGSCRRWPCSATWSPNRRGRSFAPFAVFSPEWQAIALGERARRAVRAIDLPLAVTFGGTRRTRRRRARSASRRRPTRSAISPRRPATPTRNAGGRT